jgi:hypothetical protein
MEPRGSLPHSQEPATSPYPEPPQSSPCPDPTTWRFILILSSHLRLGLPNGRLPSRLPTKILYTVQNTGHNMTYLVTGISVSEKPIDSVVMGYSLFCQAGISQIQDEFMSLFL